jgi:mitochondrial enoyl-[acyl-carrier protein] reductase / trans-2-enoyl-CoA reductase
LGGTVKQALLDRYGTPEEVVRCAEVPDPGKPGFDEVVFDVLAFPINPADLSMCRGTYGPPPSLPATPGAECIGRVVAVGAGVSSIRTGDLVINLERQNWTQKRRVREDSVVVVPPTIDPIQGSMLRINPATAQLLLTDVTALRRADWVIQNVANSAVGRHVIRLAHERGLRTINIVRRESVLDELRALGADLCLLDTPDVAHIVSSETSGALARLGLDAVSGGATARIATAVGEGGVVCNYGAMSRDDPVMSRLTLSARAQSLVGFNLGRSMARRSLAEVRALYADLGRRVAEGTMQTPIEKVFPIEEIQAALSYAQQAGRAGKVVVQPNGRP